MIEQAPFLHYMIKDPRHPADLVSPAELPAAAPAGGCLVAPVTRDGRLLPVYRFDFSIYLGSGQFMKGDTGKCIFPGLAFCLQEGTQPRLHAAFGYPPPFFPGLSQYPFRPLWFPVFKETGKDDGMHLMYLFAPANHQKKNTLLRYKGRLQHRDFANKFIELQPSDKHVLDNLLEHWGISIIGCDPFTRYSGLTERSNGSFGKKTRLIALDD